MTDLGGITGRLKLVVGDGEIDLGTPEAGALRRRSMDLTRALAELRKP